MLYHQHSTLPLPKTRAGGGETRPALLVLPSCYVSSVPLSMPSIPTVMVMFCHPSPSLLLPIMTDGGGVSKDGALSPSGPQCCHPASNPVHPPHPPHSTPCARAGGARPTLHCQHLTLPPPTRRRARQGEVRPAPLAWPSTPSPSSPPSQWHSVVPVHAHHPSLPPRSRPGRGREGERGQGQHHSGPGSGSTVLTIMATLQYVCLSVQSTAMGCFIPYCDWLPRQPI